MGVKIKISGDTDHFAFNNLQARAENMERDINTDTDIDYCLSALIEHYHETFSLIAQIDTGPLGNVLGNTDTSLTENLEKNLEVIELTFGKMLIEYLGWTIPDCSKSRKVKIEFKFIP